MDTKTDTVEFHYLKGPDFRAIHVDGAIGGITTKGFLHVALFTERAPIPQSTTFVVAPDGLLGEEITEHRKTKEGVIRQMEIDLILNEDTANDLRNWLDQRLSEFQDRRRQIEQRRKATKKP